MIIQDQLDELFPHHRTPEWDPKWEAVKSSRPIGSRLRGVVVLRVTFGVFLDVRADFPALLRVVDFHDAGTRRYTLSMYPQYDEVVEARVVGFDERLRQIVLTQRVRAWFD